MSEIVRGSRIAHIIREVDHIDVLVVADPSKSATGPVGGLRAALPGHGDASLGRDGPSCDALYRILNTRMSRA